MKGRVSGKISSKSTNVVRILIPHFLKIIWSTLKSCVFFDMCQLTVRQLSRQETTFSGLVKEGYINKPCCITLIGFDITVASL
jgi:hypothetical protein